MRHLWVIEWLTDREWRADTSAYTTRQEAREDRSYWISRGYSPDQVRVVKYAPEGER